jgi:hemolysin III
MSVAPYREDVADRWVHVLGLGLGLPAALGVVAVAAVDGAQGQLAPVALYAAGLLAMLGCSAAYNLWRTPDETSSGGISSTRRDWLRRLDHAAIFAMIAGTYTPFTLKLERAWALGLTAAIWALAAAGIAAKLARPRLRIGPLRIGPNGLHAISVALYLALGWIGLLAIGPFMASLGAPTLALLAVGGALYTAGVVFHLWQRLPYQNAIWHGFVLAAAGVHYAAVWTVLGV